MLRDGLLAAGCLAAGLGLGYGIWGRPDTVVEAPLPEKRQADGSLVLERQPGTPGKAPHKLPKAGKEVRRVSVTVQPSKPASGSVRLDLSLLRLPDGSGRVVASSPDGRISEGMDIPLVPVAVTRVTRWAAGASYGLDRDPGVFLHRDIWRVRIGAEARAGEARLLLGWTW